MQENLMGWLTTQGYHPLREIPGKGVCGLHRLIFTCGLFVNITWEVNATGRYCYENLQDALYALYHWDGLGYPPGNWIKYKGLIVNGEPAPDWDILDGYTGSIDNPNYEKVTYETRK